MNNVVSPFDLADSYYPHFEAAVKPVAAGGGAAAGVMMAMNEVRVASCFPDFVARRCEHHIVANIRAVSRRSTASPHWRILAS